MKKTKKLFGIIMAAMLTATMMLGSFSAGAVDQSTGTEDSPAQAKIVKVLEYANGITEPDNQFNFTFEKISVDNDTSEDAKNSMPALTASVAFNDDDGKYVDDETTPGMKAVYKQSANIFNGVNFPHAGVYIYEVTEDGTDDTGYGMDYSEAVYTMRVYVKNKTTGGTYVASVTAEKTTDDDGATIAGGEKVDPTPDDDSSDGISNEFAFVNTFTKKGGSEGDDNDDDIPDPIPGENDPEYPAYAEKVASLVVNKTIKGEYANMNDVFTFSLTLQKSPTSDETNYVGTVYTRGIAGGTQYEFVSGQATSFTLGNNQLLVFEDLPAGTTYTVTETTVDDYVTTTELIENGVAKSDGETVSALVGEKDNYAKYTNTFKDNDITPTGIIINNLPFVVMIVLAGVGIVFFVITRRRKYDR